MTISSARKPFFQRLKEGLEEGIRFTQGKVNLKTIIIPAPPPELGAQQVIRLRHHFQMSQREFARTLNISTKTLQSWEQGIRRPSQAALRLLQLVGERPDMVCEVVGIVGHAERDKQRDIYATRTRIKPQIARNQALKTGG